MTLLLTKLSRIKNKKASIYDPITVGAFILLTAATIIVMMYVWGAFDESFRLIVADSPGNSTIVETLDALTITYSYIDYMIPMLVGGLLIVSLVFAFKTGASIVYAFLSLLVWAFALLMAAVYTNVFEQFELAFPTVAGDFPILVNIMQNMKWLVLAWLILISLVMFTRSQKEDKSLQGGLEQFYG